MVNGLHLYSTKALYNLCLSFTHSLIHSTAIGCHAGYQPARQEEFRVRHLAQGHFDTPRVGSNRQSSDCQTTALTSWAISPINVSSLYHGDILPSIGEYFIFTAPGLDRQIIWFLPQQMSPFYSQRPWPLIRTADSLAVVHKYFFFPFRWQSLFCRSHWQNNYNYNLPEAWIVKLQLW